MVCNDWKLDGNKMLMSACHHTLNADDWHRLWEIPAIIGVKSNITSFNYFGFIVSMFYCGRIIFNWFEPVDMSGMR